MDIQGYVETGTAEDQSQCTDSSKSKTKKRFPKRGRRYSSAEKKAIMKDADETSGGNQIKGEKSF